MEFSKKQTWFSHDNDALLGSLRGSWPPHKRLNDFLAEMLSTGSGRRKPDCIEGHTLLWKRLFVLEGNAGGIRVPMSQGLTGSLQAHNLILEDSVKPGLQFWPIFLDMVPDKIWGRVLLTEGSCWPSGVCSTLIVREKPAERQVIISFWEYGPYSVGSSQQMHPQLPSSQWPPRQLTMPSFLSDFILLTCMTANAWLSFLFWSVPSVSFLGPPLLKL